jgi:3-phenylpropionate/trans-cinnamate dioxygenase ferredoxin subunit
MDAWIEACGIGDIDEEGVIRFDHSDRTFAIYRSPDDEYFATDGLCTHEKVHLADGLVMDDIIAPSIMAVSTTRPVRQEARPFA